MINKHISNVVSLPASVRLSEEKLVHLKEAIELSISMQEVVNERNWSELVVLQRKREQALREALSAPLDDSVITRAAAIVRDLLQKNEEIVSAVSDAKVTLSREYAGKRSQSQATQKYLIQY